MKILATKEYAYNLVDRCHTDTPHKFPEHNITVPDLKAVLNTNIISDDQYYKNKKCIVIGNSGLVLDKELGTDIDQFDLIVRCNLARYEQFETHVGSRTDVRFLSHKTFGNILDKNFSAYDVNYIPTSDKHHLIIRSAGNVGSMIPGFAKNLKHDFSVLGLEYNTYIDRLVSPTQYCSVGFSAIVTMLALGCDVHTYGFEFYNPSKKYHYFEECTPLVQTGGRNHSVTAEREYIDMLINQNKIKKFS